VNERSSR